MFYGQPIGVFRANWLWVALFLACAAAFGPLALLAYHDGGTWSAALLALLALCCLAAAPYLSLLTIKIFADGIVKTSVSGETEMRWDQVDRLYLEALQHRQYGIPVMTSYSLRLVDMSGNTLKVPAGLARARQLAELIVRQTTPLIMKRLLQRFNGGERLSFGSIEISRQEGIRAKANALKVVTTPWTMFAGARIKGGLFSILRRDNAKGGFAAVSRTPNVFALQHLLAVATSKAKTPNLPSPETQVQASKV